MLLQSVTSVLPSCVLLASGQPCASARNRCRSDQNDDEVTVHRKVTSAQHRHDFMFLMTKRPIWCYLHHHRCTVLPEPIRSPGAMRHTCPTPFNTGGTLATPNSPCS